MKTIDRVRTLIIPDIHQNIRFAELALSRWEDKVDTIVFLGDYFDCFEDIDNKNYFSIQKTCVWLNETWKRLGKKGIWLIGNHDVSYLSSYIPNSYRIRKNSFFGCSGYTNNKSSEINKNLSPEFVSDLELCCKVNGYIVSHAGFHYNNFQPLSSELENVKRLYNEWESDKHSFYNQAFHWIWDIGRCRYGLSDVGSPVWLDWNYEFVDIPGLPQIVGHTNGETHRQKGSSYCIDAFRRTYCVLEPNKKRPDFYTV